MELLAPGSGPLTMSSREIAELCEKRHDHVLRDARKMIVELYGEGGLPKFGETYIDPQNGQRYPEIRLPKDLTLTLVAGYSVELRKRIIDRWLYLEQQAALGAFNVPKDFASALRLAAEQVEKVALLEAKVEEARPYVEFVNGFVEADGLYTFQNAGRALGCRPNLFCAWLREARYVFRQDGVLMPYVGWRAAGLFEVKSNICESDGKVRPQSYITPKGIEFFSSRVPDEIRLTPVT